MIPRFNSSVKIGFLGLCKIWREIVFPPFCVCCKEPTEMKLFCSACWALCAPSDPVEKCPHCFENSEGLCRQCIKNPSLPFSRAYVFEDTEPSRILAKQATETIVAFMMHSWISLDWKVPDVIISMPGASEIANAFSVMIKRPILNLFTRNWECDVEAIDVEKTLLVIAMGSSMQECKQAISSLSAASPKRGYLLSLFQLRE